MTPAVALTGGGTHLPLTHYTDMVVDEASGHIFFTSGTSTVTITDLHGANPVAVNGLAGASGIALSPDGSTVYVAAASANSIAAIDTTTLAVTKPFTGLSCPTSLAFAGGKLYFSYGCTVGNGQIGSIDFSTPTPTVSQDLVSDSWYAAPYFAQTPTSSTVLVAGLKEMDPAKLVSYSVESGSPVKLATNQDGCDNLGSMAVTNDGSQVAVACGSPYRVATYDTEDFAGVDTYGDSLPYPVGVALSPGDDQLAASFDSENPNVVIYPYGDPTTQTVTDNLDAGGQEFMPTDGLRFGASGNLYAIVPTSTRENDFDLFVVPNYALSVPTITLNAPSSVARSADVAVTGEIEASPALTYPVTLAVSRNDSNGDHSLPSVVTDNSGDFSFDDSPPVDGTATYTVSYDPIGAGDSIHAPATGTAEVAVAGDPTTLTLTTDSAHYAAGAKLHLTAQLGPDAGGHVVSIYALPIAEPQALVFSGPVDSDGNLTATYRIQRSTTFSAYFDGDSQNASSSATRAVTVGGKVSEGIEGASGKKHGTFRFKPYDTPVLDASVAPAEYSVCLAFVAQRQRGDGSWQTIHQVTCSPTDGSSHATYRFTGTHILGVAYRMRAEWAGDDVSTAANGAWRRLKFHR